MLKLDSSSGKRKQLGRDVPFNLLFTLWSCEWETSRFLMDDSSSGECSTERTVNRKQYRCQLRSCSVSLHRCFKRELRIIFIFASQVLCREVHQCKRHTVYPGSTTRCNPFFVTLTGSQKGVYLASELFTKRNSSLLEGLFLVCISLCALLFLVSV